MDITDSDLDKLRRVLDGVMSRAEAKGTFTSLHLKALLAGAILHGANAQNEDFSTPRGVYGHILPKLVRAPWTTDNLPGSKARTFDTMGDLVDACRRLSLHRSKDSPSRVVKFIGHRAFDTLFEESPARRVSCRKWYDTARANATTAIANEKTQKQIRAKDRRRIQRGFPKVLEKARVAIRFPQYASRSELEKLVDDIDKLLGRPPRDS